LRKYRKSLRYLDVCWEKGELDEERSNTLRKIKSVILTNSAACKLKLGDAQGALADCEYAMQSGVENVKALFRQGQAQMALNDLDGALESLTNASQLEPNDDCRAQQQREKSLCTDVQLKHLNMQHKTPSHMFIYKAGLCSD
jgi:peptidyl-prolyl isomerase D